MRLGMIGLGRMGANLVRRLMRDGHEAVVFDVNADAVAALASEGAVGIGSLAEFAAKLEAPRVVWLMIPAGLTGLVVDEVAAVLEPGDIIIDGGNSNYRDDVRRAAKLRERGIHFVDVGTSGGVFGLERGYCLMVGGPDEAFAVIEPILKTIAPGGGDIPRTPGRDGDFARGAGLPALRPVGRRPLREDGPQRHRVRDHGGARGGLEHARQCRRGDPRGRALRRDRAARGAGVLPVHDRHAEGRRAVAQGIGHLVVAARPDGGGAGRQPRAGRPRGTGVGLRRRALDDQGGGRHGVPVPVLAAALFDRFASRGEDHYANQLLSAMRLQFGGHQELPAGDVFEAGSRKADSDTA